MQQAGARRLREDDHDGRPRRRLELVEPPDDFLAPPGRRRTITITGQPTPPRPRRRPQRSPASQPDRMALWAVLLGLFMVFMAVATGGPL